MGFRNSLRGWVDALIAGEKMDTDGQTLQIRPVVNDSGKIQIGDGTFDIDLEFFLGDTGNTVLFNVGNGRVEFNCTTRRAFVQQRTIIASGVTVLNASDFGKTIYSATADKHIQFPNPVGNAGAEFNVMQTITRNTTFQCVNATGGFFASTGDSAINTLRINTFADRVLFFSQGLEWIASPIGNTVNTMVKNVPSDF